MTAAIAPVVVIRRWVDPTVDRYGFDPRSEFVERFWLPILGPSSTWLVRRLVPTLDAGPTEVDVYALGRDLGLPGRGGRQAGIVRAFSRLIEFELVRQGRAQVLPALEVRRFLPDLSDALLARLPRQLRAEHGEAVAVRRAAAVILGPVVGWTGR